MKKHPRDMQSLATLPGVILLAGLCIAAPFLWGQLHHAMNLTLYDPDIFAMYTYLRAYDASLFPHDYVADYMQAQWRPVGYAALMQSLSQLMDPLWISRFFSLALWVLCLPMVWFAALRISDTAGAAMTLAIYLGSSIFLFRFNSFFAHSFGFFIAWWVVAALVSGRPLSLAIAILFSAAFYPVLTPIAGLTLAIWLLLPRAAPTIPHISAITVWPYAHKLVFLTATALLSAALLYEIAVPHATPYGRVLSLAKDAADYPELSDNRGLIDPFFYILIVYAVQHASWLGMEAGQMITLGIPCVLLLAALCGDKRDRRSSALLPFFYSSTVCFFASVLLSLDTAYRFVIYTAPVLVTLALPLGLYRIFAVVMMRRAAQISAASVILIYMMCIAHPEPGASGYLYRLQERDVRMLDFVKTLPQDALLAGWPGTHTGGLIELVPYIARRSALLTWRTHATVHEAYVLEMRRRMNALMEAYLSKDTQALKHLRDAFHVDYLIVNEADLTGDKTPRYMSPFKERAQTLWDQNTDKDFAVLTLAQTAGVYHQDGILILDLAKLP